MTYEDCQGFHFHAHFSFFRFFLVIFHISTLVSSGDRTGIRWVAGTQWSVVIFWSCVWYITADSKKTTNDDGDVFMFFVLCLCLWLFCALCIYF